MIKQQKFSIRKYSVGVASVVIGSLLFGSHAVLADEAVTDQPVVETLETEITKPDTEHVSATPSSTDEVVNSEEESTDSYTIEEVEATDLWWSSLEYGPNPTENILLEDARKVAGQALYSNTLTYESEKKVEALLDDFSHLLDEYVNKRNELRDKNDADGIKKLNEEYALKRLNKEKEMDAAIQVNPIRKQYSELKDRAFYELKIENPGWSFESYTRLKNVYDETLEVEKSVPEDLKYNRKERRVGKWSAHVLHMPVEEVVALSDEAMASLSAKLEGALNQLSLDSERQKLVVAYNALKKQTQNRGKYTYESVEKVEEALKELAAQGEPQPKAYEVYMNRLGEIKAMLVESPENSSEASVFWKLKDHVAHLNLAFASEKSLRDLVLAQERADKLKEENIREAIEVLHKAIDDFEILPNNLTFSNEVIKKITIEKDKVDLKHDKFVTVKVEVHPNVVEKELLLYTSLLDQRGENDWWISRDYKQAPIKKEGNVYTFVLPLYRFAHNGQYALNLQYFEYDEYGRMKHEVDRKIASKVPYTLEVQGGYEFSDNKAFIIETALNNHEFKYEDTVLFKALAYSLDKNENVLFDIYKVGDPTPVKRIRSSILGNNARTEALANTYYRQLGNKGPVIIEDLYAAFKIDATFTEGEYEIRPADFTETTMKNRKTVALEMLDRYVQRFKVVKQNKEHIVLEGTSEQDGFYTFADNDRSTDVKVKVDKNIATVKNIYALQVEALDGDLPVLGGKDYRAFEINFIDRDGNVIKFSDAHARIYIPVDREVVVAYHIKDNTKETVPFEMSEDKQGVWLDVEHFSTYAIEFVSVVTSKPNDDNHKGIDLDKDRQPNTGDTQTPSIVEGGNQVTPGSNGPTTPSKPEAKPAQPIAKPKPKADSAEKSKEAPQPSATANTTAVAPSAPTAVAQATPTPKGETLPETGEASTAWFTLASVAVLAGLGLVATKRPEEV